MKILLRFFWKARGWLLERRAKKEITKLKDGEYRLPYQIPYVSQYASKELAARYVENEDLLSTDPKWQEFGAENLDEYIFWAPKLCGIACFSMILQALRCRTPKLVELCKEAMKAGCYLPDPQNPKRLIGLLHKPFLKFAKNFPARRSLGEGGGFGGKLIWYIGANAIAKEILQNNFVIASVHRDIRHAGARPESKIGHLVLVHGFQISNGEVQGFYIHNPSGFYKESQENHFVPVEDFLNCFSGRIIVLSYYYRSRVARTPVVPIPRAGTNGWAKK